MIRLGAWSAVLLVLALQCLLLAAALAVAPGNRRANHYLAALLVVVAGLLAPFVLGYAGAYDAWPWLTFAPFAVPLAVGPLIFAHVRALAEGRGTGWPHWIAPLAQFGWQAAAFLLSPDAKDRFDAAVVEPFIGPLSDAAVIVSMTAYGIAAWRVLRRYEGWLEGRRRQRKPARRIRATILLLLPLLVARAGYSLFEALVRPINYFDLFGYYILLGLTALLLGLEGWRQAGEPSPPAIDDDAMWTERGAAWIERLRSAGWWRDPDLSLAGLAGKLGTNNAHLTRALAGHGGFAAILGAIRAEAVAAAIDSGDGGNLLDTALACGFGSKASFNRAFRSRFGVAPSAYRGGATEAASPILAK